MIFHLSADNNLAECNQCLKLHDCFAYFNQKINPWRMVFIFYFTAPVTELLRIEVCCFLILFPTKTKT